jgi:sulfur carrier protein
MDPYCDCSLSPNRLRLGPLIIIILLLIQHLYSMKKLKKIKIRINGKFSIINENLTLSSFLKQLKIPLKKVAIELNQEIVDKNKISKIKIKQNDKIEVVHFIGGG